MLELSIEVILPRCGPTLNASYHCLDSQEANIEAIHRLHGTSLIHDAVARLLTTLSKQSGSHDGDAKVVALDDDSYRRNLDLSCTACVLFHRFSHSPGGSISEVDVWSSSMASVLLAAKIHDKSMISVHGIVHAFCSIYRQRILRVDRSSRSDINLQGVEFTSPPDSWNRLSIEEQQRRLNEEVSMSTHGPIYLEWYNAIVSAESRLLHQLGYIVYWIPDHNAHKFVESFCNDLNIVVDPSNSEEASDELRERQRLLIQETFSFCKMASRIDLCVRYIPELICCAALQCAAMKLHFELRPRHSKSDLKRGKSGVWWTDLWTMKPNDLEGIDKDINSVVTAINHIEDGSDHRIASHEFIPSKLPNKGSFNDPNSFVWAMLIERLAES